MVLYPSIAGVFYAFTDWSGIGEDRSFVGLANFRTLLGDEQAMGSLGNTLLLTVAIVVVQNGIGLLLALGVHAKLKSRALLRVIFFAPVVVSPVMVAFLWKYIYNPDPSAGLNGAARPGRQTGWATRRSRCGRSRAWSCGSTPATRWSSSWPGWRACPKELHEAAMIDGAGTFQRFRYVTWPLLAPALTINLMLSTIGGLKLFDQIFATTNGGPGYATETLSTVLYKQAFVFGKFGYSTAIALVLALFVAAVSLVQIYYLRSPGGRPQ